jgi:hypothetical protein
MLKRLKKLYAGLVVAGVPKVVCPQCQHRYPRFSVGQRVADYSEATHSSTCPQCGLRFRFDEAADAERERALNIPGPVARPAKTRVVITTDGDATIFHIPRSNAQVFMFSVILIWNLGLGMIFLLSWLGGFAAAQELLGPVLFVSFGLSLLTLPFFADGVNLHARRLRIDAETARLQGRLFSSREDVLPVRAITRVRRWEDSADDSNIHLIELVAGTERLHFGEALSEAEQHWLRWEIRQVLLRHGAPLIIYTPP